VKSLAVSQSQVDHVSHLHRLLVEDYGVPAENAKTNEVSELQDSLRAYEEAVRQYGQKIREASPARKEVSCPVCTPAQRGVWDSTLWRLEQWLIHAEGKLKVSMKKRPPSDLEQLENAILKQRELVLDLDSHRSLVSALTNVLAHLNEHGETSTMGPVELEQLRERLSKALELWKKVCHNTALWQARLQIALIENSSFYATIERYEELILSIQEKVNELEPVDLSAPRPTTVMKWRKFVVSLDHFD
jgi:tetratricopeptide (TPR) repeat protein